MIRKLDDHIKADDVNKYLSPTFDKDTNGKLAAGQRVSNLGQMALVKLNRIIQTIKNICSGGEWINNASVLVQLDSNIKKMSREIVYLKNFDIDEAEKDQREIGEIVAKLEQSGANIESIQAISTALTYLSQQIENKKKLKTLLVNINEFKKEFSSLAKIKEFNKEFSSKVRDFKGGTQDKELLLATASKFLEEFEKNELEALKDTRVIDAELELRSTIDNFRNHKVDDA